MAAPEAVRRLVERFAEQHETYKQSGYNETQVRREFIDPLFKALGWDIDNREGKPDQYKDVIHEDAIKVGGLTKAPDYCFRIGGDRKFFVEAKKPAVPLASHKDSAFQLKRYAWSAGLPLGILTDFEEIAVYDCRIRPKQSDPVTKARLHYFRFDELAKRWQEFSDLFSRQAVENGSLDEFTSRKARGSATVDKEFLKEIERWRELLAKNIAIKNRKLTTEQLNRAVQQTIDRLIFLRICEDRGIESYGRLKGLLNSADTYDKLTEIFRLADKRYNSGLFHFAEERSQATPPDTLTLTLKIDDEPLKDIIKHLYYPDSPYEFSVLPTEILGHVYEQFLGKVIRLTSGHHAKIEEKPEVRKAGGVYYTPRYIVDYIVEQTVGELVKGKRPVQVAKLKVLDPACGSGSFLLGAYQYLLDWHRDWYLDDGAAKHARGKDPKLYKAAGGEWRLTAPEKRRILLNNIHGVDIDAQAVEVTKLSLLLKVLEDVSSNALQQFGIMQERALPDLGNNIKCGNSLIGHDYFEGQMLPDEDEVKRINPFDWEDEFAEIMRGGGFDAVIGNPPYLNVDDTWGKGDSRLEQLKQSYPDVYTDKTDLLFYFLAKAVSVSKNYVSFITSRAFLDAYKAQKLRSYLANHSQLQELVDFRNYQVFRGVGITTCIATFTRAEKSGQATIYQLKDGLIPEGSLERLLHGSDVFDDFTAYTASLSDGSPWSFTKQVEQDLSEKIDNAGEPLGDVLDLGQGMQTGKNTVFGKRTLEEIRKWKLPKGMYFKRATNSDIRSFAIRDRGEYVLFLENVKKFSELPSGLQSYLKQNKAPLEDRAAFRRGDCEWWKFTWPLHKEKYNRTRILCPYLAAENRFAIDEKGEFLSLTDTTVLFDSGQKESLYYILALLNSKLLSFRFRSIGKLKGGGVFEYFWNSVSKIPVRRIDFSDEKEKALHSDLVRLAKQTAQVKGAGEQGERQRVANMRKINEIVYGLYDLTDDEIKEIEASSPR